MSDRRGFLQKFWALIGIGVASKLPDVVGDGTNFYEPIKTVIPNTNLYPMPKAYKCTGDLGDGLQIYDSVYPCSGILSDEEWGRFMERNPGFQPYRYE